MAEPYTEQQNNNTHTHGEYMYNIAKQSNITGADNVRDLGNIPPTLIASLGTAGIAALLKNEITARENHIRKENIIEGNKPSVKSDQSPHTHLQAMQQGQSSKSNGLETELLIINAQRIDELNTQQTALSNAATNNIEQNFGRELTADERANAASIFEQSAEAQACLMNYEGVHDTNTDLISLAEDQAASELGDQYRANSQEIQNLQESNATMTQVQNTSDAPAPAFNTDPSLDNVMQSYVNDGYCTVVTIDDIQNELGRDLNPDEIAQIEEQYGHEIIIDQNSYMSAYANADIGEDRLSPSTDPVVAMNDYLEEQRLAMQQEQQMQNQPAPNETRPEIQNQGLFINNPDMDVALKMGLVGGALGGAS